MCTTRLTEKNYAPKRKKLCVQLVVEKNCTHKLFFKQLCIQIVRINFMCHQTYAYKLSNKNLSLEVIRQVMSTNCEKELKEQGHYIASPAPAASVRRALPLVREAPVPHRREAAVGSGSALPLLASRSCSEFRAGFTLPVVTGLVTAVTGLTGLTGYGTVRLPTGGFKNF
jgi:hypothetical protein